MARTDLRRVVGNRVSAKATLITALSECHWHYGSEAKTKRLIGKVLDVKENVTQSTRKSVNIVAQCILLGGMTKDASVNILSIRHEPDPETPPRPPRTTVTPSTLRA